MPWKPLRQPPAITLQVAFHEPLVVLGGHGNDEARWLWLSIVPDFLQARRLQVVQIQWLWRCIGPVSVVHCWAASRISRTLRNVQFSFGEVPAREVFKEKLGKQSWVWVHLTPSRSQSCKSRYVDIMRQTRMSIDNASEHTLNDFWIDEKEVLILEEWMGIVFSKSRR